MNSPFNIILRACRWKPTKKKKKIRGEERKEKYNELEDGKSVAICRKISFYNCRRNTLVMGEINVNSNFTGRFIFCEEY